MNYFAAVLVLIVGVLGWLLRAAIDVLITERSRLGYHHAIHGLPCEACREHDQLVEVLGKGKRDAWSWIDAIKILKRDKDA